MIAARSAVNQVPRTNWTRRQLLSKQQHSKCGLAPHERDENDDVSVHKAPAKSVHFALDENCGVKTDVYEYELVDKNDFCFSVDQQRDFSITAKLEGRRFYRLHRKTVQTLETHHHNCSEFHWTPEEDVHESEFFRQWADSEARGLERKVSKQQVFYTERVRVIETVLRQQDVLRSSLEDGGDPQHLCTTTTTAQQEYHRAEALREYSQQVSHRSRVFAYHMASGDAAVARSYYTPTVGDHLVAC